MITWLLFAVYLLGKLHKSDESLNLINIQSPSPNSTATEQISTATPTITIEPNPIVTCTSSVPECQGQTLIARRSDCSKIICCGLYFGVYELYSDATKCELEQRLEQKAYEIHPYHVPYIPPIQQPLPAIPLIELDPKKM